MSLTPSPRTLSACVLTSALLFACSGAEEPSETDAVIGTGGGAATGGSSGMGTGGETSGTGGSGGTSQTEPPRWEVTGIAMWRGDKTAAYTIFHDDTCNESVDNQFDQADPALLQRNLVASFGAIAKNCSERDLWTDLEVLLSHGHEIANHSYSHLYLTDESVNLSVEIDGAHDLFEENLGQGVVTYFIFPYDSFNDSLVEHLRGLGYLGARAGTRGLNVADFPDDLRINFDVYGPGYSIYVGAAGTPCEGVEAGDNWSTAPQNCRAYVMNQYVDDIIAAGGYGIRELHSLDGEAWEPLPLSEYEAHLDYLVAKSNTGELWVTTASDAIRYRRGRDACSNVIVSGDSVLFSSVGTNCLRFATTLSYFLQPLQAVQGTVSATQQGAARRVVTAGDGSLLVDADPSQGPLTLTVDQ